MIAPGFPPARGHDEIGAALIEELALGEGKLQLQAIEVNRMAVDTAYEAGQYKLRIEMDIGGLAPLSTRQQKQDLHCIQGRVIRLTARNGDTVICDRQ